MAIGFRLKFYICVQPVIIRRLLGSGMRTCHECSQDVLGFDEESEDDDDIDAVG